MPSTVLLREEPPILRVRLNRPDRRNAFNANMIEDLAKAFGSIADDPGIRAVLLDGEGAVFCSGADLEWMRGSVRFTAEENRRDARRMAAMFEAVASCPVPVVARIHGAALGGAMGLVAASDVAVAAPETIFGFSEVRLGILPAVISPFVLRKVPLPEARRYFLTGERFDAVEARRIGLVQIVAGDDDLDASVDRVLAEMLKGGPAAQKEIKRLFAQIVPLPAGIHETTAKWIARVRAGEEAQEGFGAFFDRRPPRWVAPWGGGGEGN